MAGIVFNSRTITDFLDHFDIKFCTLLDPLRLKQAVIVFEIFDSLFQFRFDIDNGLFYTRFFGDIVLCRIDCYFIQCGDQLTRQRIDFSNLFNFITPKRYSVGYTILICWKYFQRISPYPKCAGMKIHIISLVLAFDQLAQQRVSAGDCSDFQINHCFPVSFRISQTIDTGDRSDDNYIRSGS